MNIGLMELVYTLVIPLAMLITGAVMWRFPPKYKGLGYHTARSESSPEAWTYANHLCARLMTLANIPLLIINVVAVVLGMVLYFDSDTAVKVTIALVIAEVTVICTMLGIVEAKLCKRFDKNGKPK